VGARRQLTRGWVCCCTAGTLWWLGEQGGCGGERRGVPVLGWMMCYGVAGSAGRVLRPGWGCAGWGCCSGGGHSVGGGFGRRDAGAAVGVGWGL